MNALMLIDNEMSEQHHKKTESEDIYVSTQYIHICIECKLTHMRTDTYGLWQWRLCGCEHKEFYGTHEHNFRIAVFGVIVRVNTPCPQAEEC